MTKKDLIFDWNKPESRRRDKLFAFIVVSLSFVAFAGLIELRLPVFHNIPGQGAELIRFADKAMAQSWLLEAEEKGPFPGRLQLGEEGGDSILMDGGSLDTWTDYRASVRPLPVEDKVGRVQITPKGSRVFPVISNILHDTVVDISSPGEVRRTPILIPYDRVGMEWMPENLPDFGLPATVEIPLDSLRYAMSLREDGSVAEVIPLAGVDFSAQEALERWLRSLNFKKGTGERWFGLRVEFVNGRENGPQPE